MRLKLLSVAVAAALVGGCGPNNVLKDHSAPQIVSTRTQTNIGAQKPVGSDQNDLAAAVNQKVEQATTKHEWISAVTTSSTKKPMLATASNSMTSTPPVFMKPQAPVVTSGMMFVPINEIMKPAVTVEKLSLVVRAGETWERALSRWFRENGYQTVLYYFPGGVPTVFSSIPKKTHFSAYDFQEAISDAQSSFGNETNTKFIVSYDAMNKSAVIHVPGVLVQTFNVTAGSLKANAIRLTKAYGWNTTVQDWRLQDDYYVASSWPIVTERGDIASALNALIESYPVQPQLLKSTQHVYFVQGN
ncbi:hypothetical protein E4188_23895 (plasmid) [Aeromonas media]|uniref:Toxin co-regulated pilus biosynthesis protein Q C-terminal domain-containing protein n=2 Tax=Aeromonas TaxID=642 RepID=A0ABX6NYT9_AERME|nr:MULTISPECIES: hypothetical protein [Aeromonas]ASI21436.1 hypothetical protein CE456_00905 [Aeromonas salmonicida]QJT41535.1 hypothetical protein E4188_23895 [Aeromonas media]QLI59064.1 hypothetical protein C0708_23235 [Aeromonas caviae]QLI60292.1 hypothetical protein C1C91_22885 [Aeromonas caviae]HDN9373739.1 hypothetical protein [Aeromonas salmonicida]